VALVDLTLLMDLGIVIVFGTLMGCIAKLLKQPMLIAYIAAGVIISPIGLALITSPIEIAILAELGVAFLLFTIGIQSDFRQLFKLKNAIIIGSFTQVAATTGITLVLMHFVGLGFIESLYLGLILAFSSTAIVVKQLSNMNLINTLHGRLIVGFALVQDTLAILLLPILAAQQTMFSFSLAGNLLLSFILLASLAILLNRIVLPRLLKRFEKTNELFYLILLSCCFAFIYLSNLLNFSIVVGAFIGGLTLSALTYSQEASSKITGLRDFFATIFFVSLGMQASLAFFGLPMAILLLLFLVVYFINPLIYYFISLASGLKSKSALFIGLALGQASEFSFILASQGFRLGQLSSGLFSASILVITVSMASTPYLMEQNDRIYAFLNKIGKRFFPAIYRAKFGEKEKKLEYLPKKPLEKHTVIIGAGVLGQQLVSALKETHALIAVDHDSEVVQKLINKKLPIVYGEADNEEIWQKIKLAKAKALLLTIPNTSNSAKVIRNAKKTNPEIVAIAKARDFKDALELYKSDADYVVLPEVMGSNCLLNHLTHFLETGQRHRISNLQNEFITYLKEKTKEENE